MRELTKIKRRFRNKELVRESALTTGLSAEGWYSEHSGVCMQKSGAAGKECKGEEWSER